MTERRVSFSDVVDAYEEADRRHKEQDAEREAAIAAGQRVAAFGRTVGIALTSRKIPDEIDEADLTDAQMLEATAALLDHLDDATDAYLASIAESVGDEPRPVERVMQADLRRIAKGLAS